MTHLYVHGVALVEIRFTFSPGTQSTLDRITSFVSWTEPAFEAVRDCPFLKQTGIFVSELL